MNGSATRSALAPASFFGMVMVLALAGYSLLARFTSLPATPIAAPAVLAGQLCVAIYRDGGLEFLALDPRTLADRHDRPALRIPDLTYGQFTWTASADGSTIAVMQYSGALSTAEDVTIRIVDAPSGAERLRFRTPVPVEMQYLTADGSRLFAWGPAYRPEPQRRFVWDTADGRLLADVPTQGFLLGAYDASGRRAYGLAAPGLEDVGPRDATLVAQDALSGRTLGRVRLAGVMMSERVSPRMAVSADGRRVVVLHADGMALTLVDAPTLRVLWTRLLSRAPGVADRSPPRPPGGQAPEETVWFLQLAPDGRYLYADGIERWPIDAGPSSPRLLGPWAIDLERAEVVADGSGGQDLEPFVLAPDGSALYTLSPPEGAPLFSRATVLRRLDPRTLAVTAERDFAGVSPLWLVHLAERQP